MRVQVTAKDIEEGHRGQCYSCPIALALKRKGVLKYGVGVRWINSYNGLRYRLPRATRQWQEDFDYGRPVEPALLRFDLDPQ